MHQIGDQNNPKKLSRAESELHRWNHENISRIFDGKLIIKSQLKRFIRSLVPTGSEQNSFVELFVKMSGGSSIRGVQKEQLKMGKGRNEPIFLSS